jgi:hypothetical protein
MFCDVTSCSLAEIYERFGGPWYLQLQNKRGTVKWRDSFEMPLKYYKTARRHTLKYSNPRPQSNFDSI